MLVLYVCDERRSKYALAQFFSRMDFEFCLRELDGAILDHRSLLSSPHARQLRLRVATCVILETHQCDGLTSARDEPSRSDAA